MKHQTVKIKSADGTTFFVRKEFLRWCPNPEDHHNYNLMNEYNLTRHLHNEEGPALVVSESNFSYWYEGKQVTQHEHNRLSFSTKLESLLDEE